MLLGNTNMLFMNVIKQEMRYLDASESSAGDSMVLLFSWFSSVLPYDVVLLQ